LPQPTTVGYSFWVSGTDGFSSEYFQSLSGCSVYSCPNLFVVSNTTVASVTVPFNGIIDDIAYPTPAPLLIFNGNNFDTGFIIESTLTQVTLSYGCAFWDLVSGDDPSWTAYANAIVVNETQITCAIPCGEEFRDCFYDNYYPGPFPVRVAVIESRDDYTLQTYYLWVGYINYFQTNAATISGNQVGDSLVITYTGNFTTSGNYTGSCNPFNVPCVMQNPNTLTCTYPCSADGTYGFFSL